jgi:hypothetical protein
MIGKIYALICPLTNKIRYIGQTANSLENRLQSHFNDKNNKTQQKCYRARWMRKLWLEHKLKPSIICLEDNIIEKELNNKELFYINKYLEEGYLLTNTQKIPQYRLRNTRNLEYNSNQKTFYVYDRTLNCTVYKSQKECGVNLNISNKIINSMLKTNKNYTVDYIFSYTPLLICEIYLKFKIKYNVRNPKDTIICTNVLSQEILEFSTPKDFCRFSGAKIGNVSHVLRGIKKTVKGYKIEYKNKTNQSFLKSINFFEPDWSDLK